MLKSKPFRRALGALVVVGMSAAFSSACSTPPKPKELTELERILQAPDAREVKDAPGASKFYRESRKYRRVALENYDDGDIERAQEYAILGKLRYRAAAAIKQQFAAKERLDAANAQIAEVNPKIQALSQERSKLQNQVSEVERQLARARNQKAQEDRRKEALRNASLDRNSDTSEAEDVAVRNKIEAAKSAKQDALDVQADEFAKGSFNRANNQLKSTLALYESQGESPDAIMESADEIVGLFENAAEQARPQFQEHQSNMKAPARRQALREDAKNNFGAPFTIDEPTGVRVVLAMLFDKGSANIRPSSQALVKAAAELAQEYDEADIVIEGYTQKGNATDDLSTSALRAKTVRNFIGSQGVDDDRMSTNGLGQSQARFSDEAAKNDRVEIIFRIPN